MSKRRCGNRRRGGVAQPGPGSRGPFCHEQSGFLSLEVFLNAVRSSALILQDWLGPAEPALSCRAAWQSCGAGFSGEGNSSERLSCFFEGLYWRIWHMDLVQSAVLYSVMTLISTYLVAFAYKNVKFVLKHK